MYTNSYIAEHFPFDLAIIHRCIYIYCRCGFFSAGANCKISKKLCAILDVLKVNVGTKLTTPTYVDMGRCNCQRTTLCVHAHYKLQSGRRQELLFDTDKPCITLHIDLGCVSIDMVSVPIAKYYTRTNVYA